MNGSLASLSWPLARGAEAIEALGRAARLTRAAGPLEVPALPASATNEPELSRWIRQAAAWLSLEAEPVMTPHAELEPLLEKAGPALLELSDAGQRSFIALLHGDRHSVTVLDPSRMERRVKLAELAAALRASSERDAGPELDRLLDRVFAAGEVAPARRGRVRAALLRERFAPRPLRGFWLLRAAPDSSVKRLGGRSELPSLLARLMIAHALSWLLLLLSWWAVARGALSGRVEPGWLAAWLLLLASLVPVRLWAGWSGSRLARGAYQWLSRRLLLGASKLDPSHARRQGFGQLQSRVLESAALEALGVRGGLLSLTALVELALCAAVLTRGAAPDRLVALLAIAVVLSAVSSLLHFVRSRRWTEQRLDMTHDLIEKMVGHRTRCAQQPRAAWHAREDQALERYMAASQELDRSALALSSLPRLWLVTAIAALGPELVGGSPDPPALALSLGGVLLARRALEALARGAASLVGAAIAWRRAKPLLSAAERKVTRIPPSDAVWTAAALGAGAPLIDTRQLRFRHRPTGEPVIGDCTLTIRVGDRLLLEGPSGGGKSTFASLLTGVREPESGSLLIAGLDRHTLDADGWRRHVVAAPQFHDNHVFGASFAFNLLMGRRWPPEPGDLELAERVCRELELGELIERMPAGLNQMLGETGWQLSHGERSRLFIARALLQEADLLVLDESFAALDPQTLERALACVLSRAKTLLVIAHP